VAKTSSKRRTSHVVAVAAAEKSSAVEEVLAKGFHSGVSDEAIDMMSFVRCHKSILGRGGLSVSQAQLFTKVDTANAWISVRALPILYFPVTHIEFGSGTQVVLILFKRIRSQC